MSDNGSSSAQENKITSDGSEKDVATLTNTRNDTTLRNDVVEESATLQLQTSISDDSDAEEEAYTIDELTNMYDDADAVLGASDPDNCSYTQGYMGRQALYACLTCNNPKDPEASRAGVCLACANKCHEGHTLVELYTKRKFRCDCGNGKFRGQTCALVPKKDAKNVGNSYNQNYDGLYCTCKRPYPDEENPENDSDMIQCIVCEDWFHDHHAFGHRAEDVVFADGKDVISEMICASCTKSCDFLRYYEHLKLTMKIKESEVVDIDGAAVSSEATAATAATVAEKGVNESGNEAEVGTKSSSSSLLKAENDSESRAGPSPSCSPLDLLSFLNNRSTSSSQETVDSGLATSEDSIDSANSGKCLVRDKTKAEFPDVATLWEAGWRKQLCKCDDCMNMYYKLGVSFIVDENDTLDAYEAMGKSKIEEQEKVKSEELNTMWNKLDHVTKVEAMIGINEMKEHLKNFMVKHNGKIIRRKDVEEFTEGLQAKRAKRFHDGDGVPPGSCR